MNNFNIIYKILKILEKAMDCEEFDIELISAETLGISKPRWNAIMEMLVNSGYIKGASVITSTGGRSVKVSDNTRITLIGLEYLENNSMMSKAKDIAKGIKDIVPRFIK